MGFVPRHLNINQLSFVMDLKHSFRPLLVINMWKHLLKNAAKRWKILSWLKKINDSLQETGSLSAEQFLLKRRKKVGKQECFGVGEQTAIWVIAQPTHGRVEGSGWERVHYPAFQWHFPCWLCETWIMQLFPLEHKLTPVSVFHFLRSFVDCWCGWLWNMKGVGSATGKHYQLTIFLGWFPVEKCEIFSCYRRFFRNFVAFQADNENRICWFKFIYRKFIAFFRL